MARIRCSSRCSSGAGAMPSSWSSVRRSVRYTFSASLRRPECVSASISLACAHSFSGWLMVSDRSSPISCRYRPSARSVWIRSACAAVRSSSSRALNGRRIAPVSTSASTRPRNTSSARRKLSEAFSCSPAS
ncbi:hypothetical protein DMP23_44215 [Amycolatopsis sp. A1MSW2902]